MRKFIEIVKVLIMSMIVAVMILPAMTCHASDSVTGLNHIIGNWYDSSGNMSLVIGNDYSINGCKILKLNGIGGGYEGSVS